ncbi:MAG TPA: tetratricopeptide repeat protein [Alphaproteobacteria bacterium]|nr:tetratricopeptide repeat protein [Alphaproteobacteria bacterium]
MALCVGWLLGCAAAQIGEQASPPGSAAEAAPFDRDRSAALLAQARAAEEAGRTADALTHYRDAALAWPDNLEAWRGLGETATEPQERAAAAFMIERVTLYPGDALHVQREVNRALDSWIAEQRALPGANPVQIRYAEALSSFYDWGYAARGRYQAPRPFLNVRARDIPAVIVSAGGLAGYIGSVAMGAGEGSAQ